MPINVTVGANLNGVQIGFNVTKNSDMLSDYSDLIFTNGSDNRTVAFWIENYTSVFAYVWVFDSFSINVSNNGFISRLLPLK